MSETDKAAALAEKHGFKSGLDPDLYVFNVPELVAMLADHKQQVRDEYCDELVAKAGVMPKSYERYGMHPYYFVRDSQETFAAMQAQLEQYQEELTRLKQEKDDNLDRINELADKLEQSDARVAELEKGSWRSYKASIILANGSGMRKALNPMSYEDRVTGALECLRGDYDDAMKKDSSNHG